MTENDLPHSRKELFEKLDELNKESEEAKRPLSVDDLVRILGSTIKHDDDNKVITFLSLLNTYTEDDQLNIGFLAESSTGKSYLPLELAQYFPLDDVIKLGYASPSSFFHDWGIPQVDPSDKRDVEDEKKRKQIHIDLHQKILIFLDQPHDQLLQRLRSLLSHDEKQIVVKIADRSQKSGLRTKTVIIEGYPTVVFCTAKFSLQDQEKTRLLLLSPQIDQEKLRETIALKIDKESDREAYHKRIMEDLQRQMLTDRVWMIRQARVKYVKVPLEFRQTINEHFLEAHKYLIPRHQRDISRLMGIIKGHALLNFSHRKRVDDSIFVTLEDVEVGFRLYSSVSEANELGLSPELFSVYEKLKQYIEDKENGITVKDFQKDYYTEFHKVIGEDSAKSILHVWASVGLVIAQPDPEDRRFIRYTCPDMGATNSTISEKEIPPPQNPFISSSEDDSANEKLKDDADAAQLRKDLKGMWQE